MSLSVPIAWRNAIYATNGRVLSWRGKAVAGPISIHMAKDGGSIRPSVELLAEEASLSPRTVFKGLAELRDAGFLIVERKGGGRERPTLYRAVIPAQTVLTVHRLKAKRMHDTQGLDSETLHVGSETLHVRSENPARGAEEDVQEDVHKDVTTYTRANARETKKSARRSRSKKSTEKDWEGVEAYDR
jgi:DNA-binding transcriptional ArsR family regulator